jgi:hypothetical protein
MTRKKGHNDKEKGTHCDKAMGTHQVHAGVTEGARRATEVTPAKAG